MRIKEWRRFMSGCMDRLYKSKRSGAYLKPIKQYGNGLVMYTETDALGTPIKAKRAWSMGGQPQEQCRLIKGIENLIELK